MYPAILHYRPDDRKTIYEIPGNAYTPGHPEFPASGGCGDDRICRDFRTYYSDMGKRGADLACRNQLGIGCDICAVCCAATEIQDESDFGHGACGSGESGDIRSAVVGVYRMSGSSVKCYIFITNVY